MRAALAVLLIAACRSPMREPVADPSTGQRPPESAPAFAIRPPQTVVWVVAGDACTRLTFLPESPDAGAVLIRGTRLSYQTSADRMELRGASATSGEGMAARPCRTELRVGPGITLGGAEVFGDEAGCLAGKAKASALDDSAAATSRRCRGEDVPVKTDEVVCGAEGRYAIAAGKPGCIAVALSGMVLGR